MATSPAIGFIEADGEITRKQPHSASCPGFDPDIHEAAQREQYYGLRLQRVIMDRRVIGERSDAILRPAMRGDASYNIDGSMRSGGRPSTVAKPMCGQADCRSLDLGRRTLTRCATLQ
jgi:hypothetical protein